LHIAVRPVAQVSGVELEESHQFVALTARLGQSVGAIDVDCLDLNERANGRLAGANAVLTAGSG
jgi:hypothetical protein